MINGSSTGAASIGEVPLGSHFCAFHRTQQDLVDVLVPYFAAGLQRDEFCFWVTSDPCGVEGARMRLRKAAPSVDRNVDAGQIEIWDYQDWYLRHGHFDADHVFGQWLEKKKRSLESGYSGFRVTGDTAWLRKRDWPDFMDYEAEVNRALPQHPIIGLCTYPLKGYPAQAALEVLHNHQFGLTRIAGEWKILETPINRAIEKSRRRDGIVRDQPVETDNSDAALALLDERVRTQILSERLQRLSSSVLEQQDNERREIAKQLHEVTAQNLSAIAMYLAGLEQRRRRPSEAKSILAECHTLCHQSLAQILTLSQLLHPAVLDEFGLAACLWRYVEEFMKRSCIHVDLEIGPEIGRLPLQSETHLFRVAQDALSNIAQHSGSSNAIVRLHREPDQVILQIEDFGRGMSAAAAAAVPDESEKGGLGILRMRERLRKIGGHLEIRSSNQGTLLTATVRPLA